MKYYVGVILDKQKEHKEFTVYLEQSIDGKAKVRSLDDLNVLISFGSDSNKTLNDINKDLEEKTGFQLIPTDQGILGNTFEIESLDKVRSFFLNYK